MPSNVTVTRTGDWAGAKRVVSRLKKNWNRAQSRSLGMWASHLKKILVGHIDNQDLPWKALSTYTVRLKAARGYSAQIMVMTGTYRSLIESDLKISAAASTVTVGIPQGAIHPVSKKSVADIARENEYGAEDKNVPARPLWEPSIRESLPYLAGPANPAVVFLKEIYS